MLHDISNTLVATAGLAAAGGIYADLVSAHTAKRHLLNPAWPPHSKFHNAQGAIMGVGLALLTLYLLFGLRPGDRGAFLAAAASASLYWIGMLCAGFVPHTAWNDPEFEADARLFGQPVPLVAASSFLGLIIIALVIELIT